MVQLFEVAVDRRQEPVELWGVLPVSLPLPEELVDADPLPAPLPELC